MGARPIMPEKVVEKNGSEQIARRSWKTEMVLSPLRVGADLHSALFKPIAAGEARGLLPNLSILTIEPVTSVTASVIDITRSFESVSLALCLRGRNGDAVA